MTDVFVSAEWRALFALCSAIISMLAYLPYYRDTWAGRTSPQRASWLIWSILSAISFVSQVAEGATTSLAFAGIQSAGTIGILVLAIRHGTGGFLNPRDATVLLVAAAGLGLWYVTDNAVWALCISCGISFVGGTVTVMKAYQDPESETLCFWVISLVAAWFAIGSVGELDPVLLMYPAYLVALKTAIVAASLLGRAKAQPVLPTHIFVSGGPRPGFAGKAPAMGPQKQ